MSEETPAVSAERDAAEIARANAEATKFLAEADKARLEGEKHALDVAAGQIKLKEMQREAELESISDFEHHVYRFSDAVTALSAARCMTALTAWHRRNPDCTMEVIFTSPGGSIIDGMALFDHLRHMSNLGHHVTTGCLGWAASMAGILLQAGDTRWVGPESWVMIHRAAFGASGKTFDIEDEVAWVQRIEKRIVAIFEARSQGKLTAKTIRRNWDRKDWWIDSDEALAKGLVDEVR